MKSYRQFNTPREAAARLAYATHLVFAVFGLLLLVRAGTAQSLPALACSASVLLLAVWVRLRLRREGLLAYCLRSLDWFDHPDDDSAVEETEESLRFETLLRQRHHVEALRGTPEFDPWALSSLRHQIRDSLRLHPEFAALLRLHDRTSPEHDNP